MLPRLSLAGASSTPIGSGGDTARLAIAKCMRTDREPAAGFTDGRNLLILHLDQSARSPTTALWYRLLVGGKVEQNEENQVRRDNADSGNSGELFSSTLAGIGHVRPVCASEVGVRGEVDEACSN